MSKYLLIVAALICVCLFGAWSWFWLFQDAPVHTKNRPDVRRSISKNLSSTPLSSTEITDPISVSSSTTGSSSASSSLKQPPQFVVLAFDGSRSIQMWKQTRAFAQEMSEQGAPLHFTYFINPVYLINFSRRMIYVPPAHATGTSPIGWATSDKDVADRIEQMNLAVQEGHEIGSHAVGHYSGTTWTQTQWEQELDQFQDFVAHAGLINHLEHEPFIRQHLILPKKGIQGFRAPELGTNSALWPVLKKFHYRYDTSRVTKPEIWPSKIDPDLWEFPLANIRYNTSTSHILSMDYNFYFKQSHAIDVTKKGTETWQRFHDEILTSYRNYFKENYTQHRAPVFIGHHFSEWNDGVYWEALKDFAKETCGQPDVHCVTFSELADYMDTHPSISPTPVPFVKPNETEKGHE